eukprot:6284014-Lingulodinium_polyedra.AAC.1
MSSMSLKYLLEKITKHLTQHPSEAGQCWIALQQGWHSSSSGAGNKSLNMFLPDGNSRMSHVAAYFIIA